ncbi:MAG: site-2 protease family protein [Oscillospiraceae bacterium]|nr:site-2 protease family protein [Oscillospiraceae bacterium]
MYIVIAIIAFGLLIAIHELGHFTAAKALGVKVNEFAIGMGPKILRKQGKETLYTLRALPFGGFCAMDEDVASDDPRAFTAQKRWRRVIILAAGGIANFLAACIIIIILVMGYEGFGGTTLVGFAEASPNEGVGKLMVGDTIVSINGEKLYYKEDFSLMMQIAGNNVDLVILRNGEYNRFKNFQFEQKEYIVEGEPQMLYGITFNRIEGTFGAKMKYAAYSAMNYVRLIRLSIAQLISGAAGITDLAGPVAIVDTMNGIGKTAGSFGLALAEIARFTAFIGVNIALVNLLPIPAMDGGRILFVFITWFIEKVTRRKLDPKYEGYIHTAAMVLLMGLMVFVLVNDVLRIVSG